MDADRIHEIVGHVVADLHDQLPIVSHEVAGQQISLVISGRGPLTLNMHPDTLERLVDDSGTLSGDYFAARPKLIELLKQAIESEVEEVTIEDSDLWP